MKHRKLYPSSSQTNQTLCPDLCDSSCPYDCHPYSDTYAAAPSPPPPPPPPLLHPASSKHGLNISPFIIVIATLLGFALLILTYYLIIVRNCAGLNPFRPRRRQQQQQQEQAEERGNDFLDHPIWYIRTVGLQPSVINSISVFRYKKGESLIEGADCSICLNEYQNDEILRLLPKCQHAFHIPCIDTWLRSHTNCPVCRSGIVSSSTISPQAQNGLDYDSQSRDAESSTDGGLRPVTVDSDDSYATPRVENDSVESGENRTEQVEIQPMRRSVSADSGVVTNIRLAVISLPVPETGESEPGEKNTSKSSQTSPVSMKRSLSCGGRPFFSRHSRSLTSVLPL